MASQQFGHAGHAIPSSNVGMSVVQSQQLQYSQPMQQLAPRPIQPGHPAPSSQAIPMPYFQMNRPLTSVPPHSQQTVPHLSNHMPGLAVSGATPHSSYTVCLPQFLEFSSYCILLDFPVNHLVPFTLTSFCTFSVHTILWSASR